MVFNLPNSRSGQLAESVGQSGRDILSQLLGHKLQMKQQAALQRQKQEGKQQEVEQLLSLLGLSGGGGQDSEAFAAVSEPGMQEEGMEVSGPGGTFEEVAQQREAGPEQLLLASLLNPQAASVFQRAQAQGAKERQFQETERRRAQEARAGREHGIGSKTFQLSEEIAQRLPHIDRTIQELNQSVDKSGFWTLGNLSRLTGIKGLESSDSAVFNSAVKELFLTDVKGIARPNQFIERTLSQALPEVGKNKKANQAVILGMEAKRDVDRFWSDKVEEIGALSLEEKGYVPANVGKQASKAVEEEVSSRYKQLSKDLKSLGVGKTEQRVEVTGPDGKRYTIPKSQKADFQRFMRKESA